MSDIVEESSANTSQPERTTRPYHRVTQEVFLTLSQEIEHLLKEVF